MRMLTPAKVAIAAALASAAMAQAQTLPTAKSIAAEMGLGWNLGNTMEATGGPTAWGNFVPPQSLIDSVKKAGFNTIRLPLAWDANANPTTHVIDAAWMAQAKSLVDRCIKDSLFVVINIHWDGGWLENKIDSSVTNPAMKANIIVKQGAYWRQIATTFRDYDRHLLFAGANEPNVADAASQAVLEEFLQVFVDTVRATGGNNASRTLILQGPNTNIEKSYELMNLPTDKINDRLMAEVHFYPYQFSLMDGPKDWGGPTPALPFYYWGRNNHSTVDLGHNPTWGEEAYIDSVFNLMKIKFTANNVPVLLGEFGAVKRTSLKGDTLRLHVQSRRSFYEYVAQSAKANGIIPVAWDAGGLGDFTMTVFDRRSETIFDLGLLNALRSGWGLAKLPGDTSLVPVPAGSKAMKGLYSAKDSLFGQINLGVAQPNWTGYDSVKVRAFVNGTTTYDSAGSRQGFVDMSLVTMSNSWTWREATLGSAAMNTWKTYGLRIADDTAGNAMAPASRSQVDFFALQTYSHGYRGTIYIDWIAFRNTSGTWDTLHTYDIAPATEYSGNFVSLKLIPVGDVPTDEEWKTATTTKYGTTSVKRRPVADAGLRATVHDGMLRATWTSQVAGATIATFQDIQGRTLWSGTIQAREGLNTLRMPISHKGLAILNLRTPAAAFSAKITSH